jgi:hypothetical protein
MTPAYVSDPTEPKIAPPDRWSAAPAAAPGSTGKAAATKKSA